MARNYDELRKTMTPAARRRAEQRTRRMLRELLLSELRLEAGMTQAELAEALDVRQPAVSKLEKQPDMHVSTLRRIVEALGGELEIVAKLPSGPVALSQFRQ